MTATKHPKQTDSRQHIRRQENTLEKLVRSPERNGHTLTIKTGTSPMHNSTRYDLHGDRKTKNTSSFAGTGSRT